MKHDDLIEIDKSRFNFPPKFTHFRRDQYECSEIAADLLSTGTDIVVVEASVGFGKTAHAEIVRQMLQTKMLYIAPKNELIHQMVESFPYSRLMKGRANYPHGGKTGKIDFKSGRATCADCVKGSLCQDGQDPCNYNIEKRKFMFANEIGITNTAYFMAAANHLNLFQPRADLTEPQWKKRIEKYGINSIPSWIGRNHLTVIDEASSLEDTMLGFFEISITQDYLRKVVETAGLKLNGKLYPIPTPPVRDFAEWMNWWVDVRELIDQALKLHQYLDPANISLVRWVARLQKLQLSLNFVESDWIYDPERAKGKNGIRNGPAEKVTLKPVMIAESGKSIFWDHIGRGIAMCGTIVNLDIWAEETGLDKSGKTFQIISYETIWNKWNRMVFRIPGVSVVKKNKNAKFSEQEWWSEYVGSIAWILMKYEEDRCLIHSVSHELAAELGKSLGDIFGNRILVSSNQRGYQPRGSINGIEVPVKDEAEQIHRDEALKKFKATPGSVLISASAIRGTDLPDDLCRNLIIAKVPWKSLADRRIRERLEKTESGNMWYMVQAVRDILQALGRGVRHENDWCRNWVVDDQFDRIVRMRGLLPDYALNAIREPGDYMGKYG